MNNFNKIMVIVDPENQTQPALLRAMQFKHEQPIELVVVATVYYPAIESSFILDPQNMEQVKNSMLQHHRNRIHTLITDYKVKHAKITIDVNWHHAIHIGIFDLIKQHQPDLVIKGTHQHTTLEKWFLNTTDSQLLRACPVPLLFAKGHEIAPQSSVLAAVDPSHRLNEKSQLDERVLKTAYGIAKHFDLPMHACHCFDPNYWQILLKAISVAEIWTDVFPANPDADNHRVLDDLRDEHSQRFRDACQEWVPNSANQHLIDGAAVDVIPKLQMSLSTSTIVIGTAYRTGLLGSTALDILERVSCDVLVVQSAEFDIPFP